MISFFSYLKIIDREIMRDSEFDEICRLAIQRLKSFVESGACARGYNTAWICQRWQLSVKELREEWEKQTGVNKSEAAFRSQICSLSKTLYKLFPEEDFGEILSGDMAEGQAPRMINTLDALEYDNIPFCTLFSEEINTKALKGDWEDYSIEELHDEIRVLKAYRTVMDKIMTLDTNKLSYIKRVIDSKVVDEQRKPELLKVLGLC
ncbi:hypothetical protein [Butyrivibrio sp. NC2002]|uniref:hypothetical protein n=1 Tax=Butyrivibrio sp. NC2002 TaxID=1410610 RepID=UPI000567E99C|nr:hypothetical protein [Butyrivibrio sp. NC2002]